MSARATLADHLLREAGHGGLWEWAMDQRRTVSPPSWELLADRLADETEGAIRVRGTMLRRWIAAAEAQRRGDG
jgi:hypothetical protein